MLIWRRKRSLNYATSTAEVEKDTAIVSNADQKDAEDQLEWSCEKWSITKSEGGEEYHTNKKKKEG